MNQARGVLALQLAREACFERTGELPAELRTVLSLQAMGESMTRIIGNPRPRGGLEQLLDAMPSFDRIRGQVQIPPFERLPRSTFSTKGL